MEKLNSTDNSYICEYCFIVNNISEAQFFINRFNLKPKKKYDLFSTVESYIHNLNFIKNFIGRIIALFINIGNYQT